MLGGIREVQRELANRKENMSLLLEPEIGIPFEPASKYMDLRVRAEAACVTALDLAEHGLDIEPNADDQEVAAKLSIAYAEDASKASRAVTEKRAAKLTPPSLILTGTILQEFGQSVAKSAVEVRHLITNKLILLTESPDSRTKLRALELLGKISDVGLFTEKSELVVTHQSTADLRQSLKEKLVSHLDPDSIIDAEFTDVDAELGLVEPLNAEVVSETD